MMQNWAYKKVCVFFDADLCLSDFLLTVLYHRLNNLIDAVAILVRQLFKLLGQS